MGRALKSLFSFIAFAFAVPFFLYYRLEVLWAGRSAAFRGMSQFISVFPGVCGTYFRRGFYILSLKKCPWDCCIEFGTVFSHSTAELGRHVYIGLNCTIGDVCMSDYVTVGSNVDIMNGGKQHGNDVRFPIQEQMGEYPKVFIGEDAWIGNSAVVMANVGKKAIVGAGSVVVKPVDDYAIVAGNPAVFIKKRD